MTSKLATTSNLRVSIAGIVVISVSLSSSFLPDAIFSAFIFIIGILLFVSSIRRMSSVYITLTLPLFLVLITGLSGIYGHQLWHVTRDILYATTPIALLLIGVWFAKSYSLKKMYSILILSGSIVALVHILMILSDLSILQTNIDRVRYKVPHPNIGVVSLSLALLACSKQLELYPIIRNKPLRIFAIGLLLLSFVLSFSRTGFIMFILLSISFTGYVGRINFKTILTVAVLITGFIILINTTPEQATNTFRSKLSNSIKEITISDYTDLASINRNWRGYEAFRAVEKYQSGSLIQKAKGFGFGALVELGLTMKLAGVDYEEIPILHNGYAYILVKTGLIGLTSYFVFFLIILRTAIIYNRSSFYYKVVLARTLQGVILVIMSSMLVVGGMAEIHDSELVIMTGGLFYKLNEYD
jgi:hypothetical protein